MALNFFSNSVIYKIVICVLFICEIIADDKIFLEEGRVCKLKPDDREASIYLGKDEDSSKIVTQKIYFASWTGRYNFKCSFSVSAPKKYGIYAVVQVLNFRKNETSNVCKDYVHFKVPEGFITQLMTKEKKHEKYFCGKIFAGQTYLSGARESTSRYGINVVSDNGFVAPKGHMHVSVYVARERLSQDEKLELNIAFTAYKYDCNKRDSDKYIECTSCEWIWKGLVRNEVQNCPYITCVDENSCKDLKSPFEVQYYVSNETGTKVTMIAVSAIMLSFFTFVTCLCACRRTQSCCWQPPPRNPARAETNRNRTNNPEEPNTTFLELPQVSVPPTAPTIEDLKDVPPSYESLFPSK